MFVVRLTNGRGFTEFFSDLSTRRQSETREAATQFSTAEEARETAQFCIEHPDAFSQGYMDETSTTWTLDAVVEPI